MALHSDDQSVRRLHGFHRAVFPGRRLHQPRSELADRLVMQAVDADPVLAGRAPKLRPGIDLDRVREVASAERTDLMSVEVLLQRAAHGDVDDLLAAADAHHRKTLLARLPKETELGVVELAVDRADLWVGLLAVESGVDVPSAWQQKTVQLRQPGGSRRQIDRLGADRLHRALVRDVVLRSAARAGRDPDPRPHFT